MAELLNFPPPILLREEIAPAPQPADSDARVRALDIQRSCIVEAPAGSGKTGLLLQRFLKLLAEGGVAEPEEVLAITFTRKAAAELRERVLEQLHAASSPIDLPATADSFERDTRALAQAVLVADARRGWRLLSQPHRLRIRTIDAVCGEIARALPLLSGSGVSHPVEDPRPLYHEAARRTLRRLGGPDVALDATLRTVILHRDGNIADCERLLARMLEQREQWAEFVPLSRVTLSDQYLEEQVRPRLERSLEAIVCHGLDRALQAMPPGALEELTELAERLAAQPGSDGNSSPIALCQGRSVAPQARPEHLDHWLALIHLLLKPGDHQWRKRCEARHLKFEIDKSDKAQLEQFIQEIQSDHLCEALRGVRLLPPSHYPEEQWDVAKALFRLLRHALAELKVLFSETDRCDFTEQSLAARAALEDGGASDLASSPTARLSHLLVDEMQDTSSAQYALIELLTRSWDGRSQTLFLVGDPKQSIYLFRQARIERFLRTVRERRLGDIPLEALQLTANFRSHPALVEAFNETFSQIFPSSAERGVHGEAPSVPFVRAEAARRHTSSPSDRQAAAITWHATVLGDGDTPDRMGRSTSDLHPEHTRHEARLIRRIIEDWRARPLPPDRRLRADGTPEPWRIAILTRARSHLSAITAELAGSDNQEPIPYRATQIDRLGERPEVLDVVALTRALLHLADRTAWLAVLRAPWCGLSLADLLTLTGEGPTAMPEATLVELVALRRENLSADGRRLLDRVWPVFQSAVQTLGRTSLAVHVERTWLSLGGDAPLTADRRANVRRFFEVLREMERSGNPIDLNVLATRLTDLYAEPATAGDAVDILTIHKSKGLEFDVVLIPGLERIGDRKKPDLLNWVEMDLPEADAAHILLAPIWSRGQDSDRLNKWLGRIRSTREQAEIRRLMYVASTRAKEELHLFASIRRNKDQSLRRAVAGTLLHASWPAARAHFERSLQQPASDLTGVLPMSVDRKAAVDGAFAEEAGDGLALAASAESSAAPAQAKPPTLHRLPLNFDPLARFKQAEDQRLRYTPASALPRAPLFDRPEGSFEARALGNVVHRFLQLLCTRLEHDSAETVLSELSSWEPRLIASLRAEGLPRPRAQREALRVLTALSHSLNDPLGRWILMPHPGAFNERALAASDASVLRADRTFLAGPEPLSEGTECVWIFDFKSTDPGSRSPEGFAQHEMLKYRAQLESYAAVRRALAQDARPIRLGLFYPFIPRLLHWNSDPVSN